MSNEGQKPAKTRPKKKIVASSTPTLVAALSLLSISLGVTTNTPAEDPGGTPNAREKTDGLKLARKAGKGQQEYAVSPSQQNKQQLQSNQHKSSVQTNQIKTNQPVKK